MFIQRQHILGLILTLAGTLVANRAAASLPNDDCTHAQSIAGAAVGVTGDNSNADPVGEFSSSCAPSSHHDVWFDYQPTCTGMATIDTAGSGQLDTVLSVYDSCGGHEILCVDDHEGSLLARVEWPVVAGVHYRVRLASAAAPGPYVLTATCASPPTNDSCATALPVSEGEGAAAGTNVLASPIDDAEASCGPAGDGDLWFEYAASCTGVVSMDTFGSAMPDPVLTVYAGCGGAEVACNDDAAGGGTLQSALQFNAVGGQSYRIRLASLTDRGEFVLNIRCVRVPMNDSCVTASPVTNGRPAAVGDNTLSNPTNDREAACAAISSGDVWYRYTATCDGFALVDTIGGVRADTVLSAYRDCGGAEIACSDDTAAGVAAELSFAVSAGEVFLLRLASAAEPGPYVLNIDCLPLPANDHCASATPIADGSPAAVGDNRLASLIDDAEGSCQPLANADVWYVYTATQTGRATVETSGSAQTDPALTVYDGCGGAEIACNDDSMEGVDPLQASVSFDVVAGSSYWIRLASAAEPGGYVLNLHCVSIPANDHCGDATEIGDGSPAISGDNSLASDVNDASASCDSGSMHDVWFRYVSTIDGEVTFDTVGSGQVDTVLSVYDDCNGVETACSDDQAGTVEARVSIPVHVGQVCLVRLASAVAPGGYQLNVRSMATPSNDHCSNAAPISEGALAAAGDNSNASGMEDGASSCAEGSNHDVWFEYHSSCNGMVTIDSEGSGQSDTVLSVFDGCGGAEIACSDDSNAQLHARVVFPADTCRTYLIRLASAAEPGPYVLSVACDGHAKADMNCDGLIDGLDVRPFTVALLGAPGFVEYQAMYPGCDPFSADLNCDAAVDMDDVADFVLRLLQQ